jgi:predicted ATP-grasp superfamily ATP-dependent carboligase
MSRGRADRVSVIAQSARTGRGAKRSGTELDVVVLDAVQRQSLVAVQSLGRLGLAVGAFDVTRAPAGFSRWCSVREPLPDAADDAFDLALDAVLDRHEPKVVIPAHDGTIEVLRARRPELEQRARLALADEPALEIAVDKRLTLDLARSLDILVPRGVEVRDAADVRAAVEEIGLPVVAKPARSWVMRDGTAHRLSGSLATSPGEAEDVVERMSGAGAEVILQEWVPGSRESVITCYSDGDFAASFALRVLRTHPPLGGSSVVRESLPLSPELVEPAHRLVRAAGLEGVSEIEFRRDAKGRLVLMEINPRLPATVELAVRAGLDFPQLLYLWALGQPLPSPSPYRIGLRLRWLGGDLRWLLETFQAQGQPGVMPALGATGTFVRDFFRPSAYDYLHRDDLRPAAVAASTFAWRSLRAGFRKR